MFIFVVLSCPQCTQNYVEHKSNINRTRHKHNCINKTAHLGIVIEIAPQCTTLVDMHLCSICV